MLAVIWNDLLMIGGFILNRKDWIRYNRKIMNHDDKPNEADKKLDDIFYQYQNDRVNELADNVDHGLNKTLADRDLSHVAKLSFHLCSKLAISETAILRLWAVMIDPKSTKDDLKDSFRIFINYVIGQNNLSLKKFNSRL